MRRQRHAVLVASGLDPIDDERRETLGTCRHRRRTGREPGNWNRVGRVRVRVVRALDGARVVVDVDSERSPPVDVLIGLVRTWLRLELRIERKRHGHRPAVRDPILGIHVCSVEIGRRVRSLRGLELGLEPSVVGTLVLVQKVLLRRLQHDIDRNAGVVFDLDGFDLNRARTRAVAAPALRPGEGGEQGSGGENGGRQNQERRAAHPHNRWLDDHIYQCLLFHLFLKVGFLNWINCYAVPRGTRNHSREALWNSGVTSADSGLQLDLGDRAKRCLSEGPAPRELFSPAEDALKRRMT